MNSSQTTAEQVVRGGVGLLSEALFSVLAKRFPAVAVSNEGRFWPMFSIESGELSSSAAIEVARATKTNAQAIADQIIAELAGLVRGEWRNDRGFIVGWGFDPEALLSETDGSVRAALRRVAGAADGETRRIWCLIPDGTEPTYARIRLVARTAMQGLVTQLFEGRADLCLHPLRARVVCARSEVTAAFREAVSYILSHPGEQRLEGPMPSGVESGSAQRVTVWTTHHFHERLPVSLRNALSQARTSGCIRLIMPLDGWLLSRDRALLELLRTEALCKVVDCLKDDESWLRFLFHAASTVPSGDFDPAVSLFEECSSPLWSLRVLAQRYERFKAVGSLPIEPSGVQSALKSLSRERKLSVQALLLPVYTARAITLGEVGEWCEALENICRRGHAFINSPQTRLALQQGALDEQSCEIAASLGFGLSSILPLLMEEGACRDQ